MFQEMNGLNAAVINRSWMDEGKEQIETRHIGDVGCNGARHIVAAAHG
jgi:hypothetical protein